MPDAADYELQKESEVIRPPTRRPPSFTPLIIGVLVLAAAVAAFLYLRRDAEPPVSTEGSLATESAVPPSAPLGVEVEPIELPPLDATDELVRSLVRTLSSHPRIAAWLTTDGLIRNFT